jgi:hypothetical protein
MYKQTRNPRDLGLLHWGFGGAYWTHFLPPSSWERRLPSDADFVPIYDVDRGHVLAQV